MELHLINGFLGSGKTTAIIAATRILATQGKAVGIVTNDKGKFQVDTAFFQSSQIPTRQVTDGCFRCSFEEFEEKIVQLQESDAPDVIFAESVGSCVDLVNTIFTPLQNNQNFNVGKTTYSVFADIRLFQRWMNNDPLPFSDKILYLFEKQIEEGPLLILNKSDLLPPAQQRAVFSAAAERFPEKTILLQNSLDPNDSLPWLAALESEMTFNSRETFKVDYRIYKKGEQEMAWLEQNFDLEASDPQRLREGILHLIRALLAEVRKRGVLAGHIKFFLSGLLQGCKISFTTADLMEATAPDEWEKRLPAITENTASLMLNMRVAMKATDFSEMTQKAAGEARRAGMVHIEIREGNAYHPQLSMSRP